MTPGQVRRQWVVKTVLVALFLHDPDGWLLKGGTDMMLRLPEARHSKDVDLATALSPAEAVDELRDALAEAPGPYRWEVQQKRAMARDKAGVSLTVTAGSDRNGSRVQHRPVRCTNCMDSIALCLRTVLVI